MNQRNGLFRRLISFWVLVSLIITTSSSVAAQVEKIRSKIEKIGVRGDLTVKLTDGKKYHGFVNKIGDDDFEMVEIDLKTNIVIRYESVRSVEKGYGKKGPFGHRPGKKGRRVGNIVMVGLAAFATVIIVVSLTKDGR